MSSHHRQQQIMTLIKEKHFCKYSVLAKELFVSESTIRRETLKMETQGLLKRTLGGITEIEVPEDVPYDYSVTQNLKEKRQLAHKAKSIIKPGMSLLIDSSTTCHVFLREISDIDNLYIVTNGLLTALEASKQASWQVSIIGGNLNSRLRNTSGTKAIQDLENYHADCCVFSCRGITNQGATDANENEAYMKRAFAKHSDNIMLLVDSTKLEKKQLYVSTRLDKLDYLACDKELPSDLNDVMIKNSVKLLF